MVDGDWCAICLLASSIPKCKPNSQGLVPLALARLQLGKASHLTPAELTVKCGGKDRHLFYRAISNGNNIDDVRSQSYQMVRDYTTFCQALGYTWSVNHTNFCWISTLILGLVIILCLLPLPICREITYRDTVTYLFMNMHFSVEMHHFAHAYKDNPLLLLAGGSNSQSTAVCSRGLPLSMATGQEAGDGATHVSHVLVCSWFPLVHG